MSTSQKMLRRSCDLCLRSRVKCDGNVNKICSGCVKRKVPCVISWKKGHGDAHSSVIAENYLPSQSSTLSLNKTVANARPQKKISWRFEPYHSKKNDKEIDPSVDIISSADRLLELKKGHSEGLFLRKHAEDLLALLKTCRSLNTRLQTISDKASSALRPDVHMAGELGEGLLQLIMKMVDSLGDSEVGCLSRDCCDAATFGWEGGDKDITSRPVLCVAHKMRGMVPAQNPALSLVSPSHPKVDGAARSPAYGGTGQNDFGSHVKGGEQKTRIALQETKLESIAARQKTRTKAKCESVGCQSMPRFKFERDLKSRFCKLHRLKGMIGVERSLRGGKPRCCESPGCLTQPSFALEGERSRFCGQHKLSGMVNVVTRRCEQAGAEPCTKTPYWNFEGGGRARFCASHKLEGMVASYTMAKRKCENDLCNNSSSYNYEGLKGARFCSLHKLKGMVQRKKRKKCGHTGCHKLPLFNFESEHRGKFCAEHKLVGMVDVGSKRCEHVGCNTHPKFNYEGERTGKFCAKHKLPGMLCVRSRAMCEHAGCSRGPIYFFKGDKARYCSQHKLEGMIQREARKCSHAGCSTQPTFNFEGMPSSFCSQHKLQGMVNVKKGCSHTGCIFRASFNFQGQKRAKFCLQHKVEGMVNVKHKRCQHSGCQKQAVFKVKGEPGAKFCAQHKVVL